MLFQPINRRLVDHEMPSWLGLLTHSDSAETLASRVLEVVMKARRLISDPGICNDTFCDSCAKPHMDKVVASILKQEPVRFVLPAFPGKSPNLTKVLSPLPDMAERLALEFLEQLCTQIQKVYAPGAKIILCSDGRVFSDIVGIEERDVTAYQDALLQMFKDLSISHLSLFSLDDVAHGQSVGDLRLRLMEQFGSTLQILRSKVIRGGRSSQDPDDRESHRMLCGITRFLVEDQSHLDHTKSRTKIQKYAKERAYQVILRSNAWSEFIADRFPGAIRLSIHPQACGAKKLGIQLVGKETWMTPWHGVAVAQRDEFTLMKRSQAESLKATLVYGENRQPSHFVLKDADDKEFV
jgi:pyoverdine/dityrosine biosynthesis protein Dit1